LSNKYYFSLLIEISTFMQKGSSASERAFFTLEAKATSTVY